MHPTHFVDSFRLALGTLPLACLALSGCALFQSGSDNPSPAALQRELAKVCKAKAQWVDTRQPEVPMATDLFQAQGWEHLTFFPFKLATDYQWQTCPGQPDRQVLQVQARGSASTLYKAVNRKVDENTRLRWAWWVAKGNPAAHTATRSKEDAPLRVVLAFGGDKTKLAEEEQQFLGRMEFLTKRPAPYATLMYTLGNGVQTMQVVTPEYTKTIRIKAVQVANAPDALGQWHGFDRNIEADFVRAFGETPGPLLKVGIMADADNTKGSSRAYLAGLELLHLGAAP